MRSHAESPDRLRFSGTASAEGIVTAVDRIEPTMSVILHRLVLPFVGTLLVAVAPAQVQWRSIEGAGQRSHTAAAFDTGRDRLVLFGGQTVYSQRSDTWEWDGSQWLALQPPTSPPASSVAQMVYDPVASHCLLVTRTWVAGNPTPLDQTWSWNGTLWTRRADAPSFGNLAFDGSAGRPVMITYGVFPGVLVVYEWNGTQWSLRPTTGTVPTWFDLRRWAFDANRGCLVMPVPGQVYELHGSVWRTIVPATSPPLFPVNFFTDPQTVTYDARLAGVVMYGGGAANGTTPMPVSLWDGTQWQQVTTAQPRESHVTVFDGLRQRLLVFGGLDYRNIYYPERRYLGDLRSFDGTWRLHDDQSAPGHLTGAAAAHDRDRGLIVTFGGAWDGTPTSAAHAFDGTRWSTDALPLEPPPRRDAAMVYIGGGAGRLLLFGGQGAGGLLGDTWVRDQQGWHQLAPTQTPSPRTGARLVFDSRRDVCVLVGGETANGASSETWEFAAGTWQLRASGYPPASAFGGLAFDARRGRTVLYGGYPGDATYEWDGTSWFSPNPTLRPSSDVQHFCSLAYDETRARCVLFVAGSPAPRTWEWDGSEWQETMAAAPSGLVLKDPNLVFFERVEGCALICGSSGWTTALRTSVAPARWESFGAGCTGTSGIPTLDAPGGARPWIGDAFPVRLTHAGATTGALALGVSSTSWNGTPLPLVLGPIMPGCALLTSIEEFRPLVLTQGTATEPLPIPVLPALVGRALHFQGVAADPGVNPAGLVLSAGARAWFGSR